MSNKIENLKIATGATKAPVGIVPMHPLLGMARVLEDSGVKYAPFNYMVQSIADACEAYSSAELRHHIESTLLGGQITPESLAACDADSGLPHIFHRITNLFILATLMIRDGVIEADPGQGRRKRASLAPAEHTPSLPLELKTLRLGPCDYKITRGNVETTNVAPGTYDRVIIARPDGEPLDVPFDPYVRVERVDDTVRIMGGDVFAAWLKADEPEPEHDCMDSGCYEPCAPALAAPTVHATPNGDGTYTVQTASGVMGNIAMPGSVVVMTGEGFASLAQSLAREPEFWATPDMGAPWTGTVPDPDAERRRAAEATNATLQLKESK